MTDFDRIKADCIARGALWEDPDFLANQTSVFYHQKPPFNFVWKRAREIYANPKFIRDNCETLDVVPGKLGDKWLVSCLGILYLNKGLFYRVVPADQTLDACHSGVFRFRIWWCGQWHEVLVDDRLPTVNGKLAFLQPSQSDQLWPALLEKAYAKLHGSYEALKYGTRLDGLADLTGGITESMFLAHITDPMKLASLLNNSSLVTAHYYPMVKENKGYVLESDMNYRICAVEKVETAENPVYLVRLRRPLAPGEAPITHFVLDQALWKTMPASERERLTSSPKGFWMLYSDFERLFIRYDMVHLDAETSRAEPSLADKQKWQMKQYHGGWRKGLSAGGCRNHQNFFHMNPQIHLVLAESDTVLISLNQHSITDPKVIGFTIYQIPNTLNETVTPELFKRMRSYATSPYTNSRQFCHRTYLEAGSYLVLPTTYEPREEANFSFRVFSMKPLKLKLMDQSPKMLKTALLKAPSGADSTSFTQYEAVFVQLADEHKTMDAFQLQELLDACLPNDYIKSCATIDTCRQIVLSMDKKGTGRISLSDFKDLMCSLKHWQIVFKSHGPEKMGVLRAERLREALREVGFEVPERVMALLVLRYMRKDGMLRFGDFVSVVMHLHRAFSEFQKNDTAKTGFINLNLSEWLKCTLTC